MRSRFEQHPTVTVIIARLVPTGRLATDLLAADARTRLPSFVRMSAAGGAVFAAFCLALAVLAGPFADRAPLAVAAGAVVASLLVGLAIDAVDRRVQRRRRPRSTAVAAEQT
jgi:membrane protein DedA with SNARE-associated domain